MSLVSGTIRNLINGVSQQAPSLRLDSQAQTQENGFSSVLSGVVKRNPTSHLAKLLNGEVGDVFCHMINRDANERYIVLIDSNSTLRVFDLEGNEKTVNGGSGTSYLDSDTPSEDFKAVSIADYTFILNKTVRTRMVPFGTAFTIEFSTFSTGDILKIELDSGAGVESKQITAAPGDSATTVATTFVNDTSWYTGTRYSVTRVGSVITIRAIGPILNDAFAMEATVTSATSPAPEADVTIEEAKLLEAFVFVKQGNYSLNYTINLYENSSTPAYSFTHTTSNTDISLIKTDTIALALKNGLNALPGFTSRYLCETFGSLIRITQIDTSTTSFLVTAWDSNGDRNMVAVQGKVQKFVDLPAKCFDGLVVRVSGDSSSESDDYYVEFTLADNGSAVPAGVGTWAEGKKPGISDSFALETMPHTLVRNADGTFTFGEAPWDERHVGDETSSPPPSFIGNTIEDIFFFRNRLGFLSDENEILSESGEYFNFWKNTVQAILDGDPIDLASASTKVSLLRYAVPCAEKLVLMSDQQQFASTGGDLFTLKTAAVKATTAYETTGICRPVLIGNRLYFTVPKGEFTGVREYKVDAQTNTDDATDVTAHVPAYIPGNVFKMTAATNEDVLALLSRDEPNSIFLYKFYFVGEDKFQASWSKAVSFPEGTTILDANFIGTRCYLVIQREDGVYLEVLDIAEELVDEGFDYTFMLDRRVREDVLSPSYNANTNLTTWTLPYVTAVSPRAFVYTASGALKAGERIVIEHTANTAVVTATGNYAAVDVIMGIPYTFIYEFSEINLKQSASTGGQTPVTGARLQLRTLTLVYDQSGYFRVEVTPTHGDTFSYPWMPKRLGDSFEIGAQGIESGEFRVPILANSKQVTIRIVNDSHLPCRFQSVSWEGELIKRARSM